MPTPSPADMLRHVAELVGTLDPADLRSIDWSPYYGPDRGPGMALTLSPAAWSARVAGRPVTWRVTIRDAEGTVRDPLCPWLRYVAIWTREELSTAAPAVATVVFPVALTSTVLPWPSGVLA